VKTSDIPGNGAEWLRGAGSEADMVLSSRIRLARNVADFPFVVRMGAEQQAELANFLERGILAADLAPDMKYIDVDGADELEKLYLQERQLISRELAEGEGKRGVAVGEMERTSVMVNEEDHVRLQVIHSGFELDECWRLANQADDSLEEHIRYAFSPRLGYLTACPTNVGTGMRASVMLHLPGLVMTKQMKKVFAAMAKLNLAVRGMYGEGTEASSDLYQLSNQVSLGKPEEEIIQSLKSVIPQLIKFERNAREYLLEHGRTAVEDRVWRAYGMLRSARTISSQEAMIYLSQLRLGVNLGLVKDVRIDSLNELFILTQPAHLQKLEGKKLEEGKRDLVRATLIRNRLGEV
jgi:protein arginine kinase